MSYTIREFLAQRDEAALPDSDLSFFFKFIVN